MAQTPENNDRPVRQPKVDDSRIVPTYANFCRVSATPEELVVDFGINTPLGGENEHPIALDRRVVINYFTAKRLYHALGMTLQRHETVFGPIEVDPNKRSAARLQAEQERPSSGKNRSK